MINVFSQCLLGPKDTECKMKWSFTSRTGPPEPLTQHVCSQVLVNQRSLKCIPTSLISLINVLLLLLTFCLHVTFVKQQATSGSTVPACVDSKQQQQNLQVCQH